MSEANLSLLNLPLEKIDYSIVEDFCKGLPEEDVDLDYKLSFPNDLDRIICAFANTQGGLLLLGIREDGKTRRPVWPPEGIEADPEESRHRVLSIAFDAVYPPIEPEVKLCAIPETSRHILVVRVPQSTLLHFSDRRSRVYIRSRDSNRGYALADLQQLQWLWDKREASVSLRESLQDRFQAHSSSLSIPFTDGVTQGEWLQASHLWVSFLPAFPQLPIVPGVRALLDLLNGLPRVRSTWAQVDRAVPWQEGQWRTTASSVCLRNRGREYAAQFIEVGIYGELQYDFLVHRQPLDRLPIPVHSGGASIYGYVVLSSLDIALKYASGFYNALAFRHPILIRAELRSVANLHLWYDWPRSMNTLGTERLSPPCADDEVLLALAETPAMAISDCVEDVMLASSRALAWSFGLGWDEADITRWLHNHYPGKSA